MANNPVTYKGNWVYHKIDSLFGGPRKVCSICLGMKKFEVIRNNKFGLRICPKCSGSGFVGSSRYGRPVKAQHRIGKRSPWIKHKRMKAGKRKQRKHKQKVVYKR